MNTKHVRPKNILITGASRGLGRALARHFVSAGSRVVLVARGAEQLARTVEEIGPGAHGIAADIGDPDGPARIAGEAVAVLGPIDLLINNASTLGPTPLRLLLDTERRDFEHVFAVNVVGPFELAKIIGGSMVLRGKGTILNVSSDAAVEPYPTWGAYGASKAALDHLSAILAAELAPSGVRVLAVDPGEMNTEMHRNAIPEADPTELAAPASIAARIAGILADEAGGRIVAPAWSAA